MSEGSSAPFGDWFNEARYGMFIHWGPYSVAGRGEWIMNRERIPKDEYQKVCVDHWGARHFDPRCCARLARDGGMRYAVLTARHHDGFALWNSAAQPWNAVRLGPRRDLVAEFLDAFRAEGLRVGLYFSYADWTHPDYPDAFARDWPSGWADEAARRRFNEACAAQLRELLGSYGPIDMLWWDGCFPKPAGEGLNALVRSLQPSILINDRNGEPSDFSCCEQASRPAAPGTRWEACMTLNANWGFHAGDHAWKSAPSLAGMLLETCAGGGNLLLNVGPQEDGSIPTPCTDAIRGVGNWLESHGEFLANSGHSPFGWLTSGRLTVKGCTAYLHLLHATGGDFCLAEIANRVLSANLVGDGRPVAFRQEDSGRLFLGGLPAPDPMPVTIALQLDGPPSALREQTTHWIPG